MSDQKISGKASLGSTALILTEEAKAQELLNKLLEEFHLDIVEVTGDGEKVDYMSTEEGSLEITVRAKEKSNNG